MLVFSGSFLFSVFFSFHLFRLLQVISLKQNKTEKALFGLTDICFKGPQPKKVWNHSFTYRPTSLPDLTDALAGEFKRVPASRLQDRVAGLHRSGCCYGSTLMVLKGSNKRVMFGFPNSVLCRQQSQGDNKCIRHNSNFPVYLYNI